MSKNNREFEEKLSEKEYLLIFKLRNIYRFGDVVIVMRDGEVVRVKKAEISDDLDGLLPDKKEFDK